MNNAIRHTWVVSVAMFVTLFAALSVIQVALTDELNRNENNARQIIADRGAPRGPITVDGSPIAESVPTDSGQFDYQRVYHDSELYSGITGFYSISEGPTGLERSLNEYLSGQSDSQFFDRITALFTGETMEGAQVELTLDGELQRLAFDQIPDGTRGSIIVTDLRTGDIKAMASKPTFNANHMAVHNSEEYTQNKERVEAIEGLRMYQYRPINEPIFPGSTFKIVDAVAMLESGDYELDTELENPDSIQLPQSNHRLPNLVTGNCHQRSEAPFIWIFAQSCNTPFAEAAMELGEDAIRDAAESFGWNESLSIPLDVTASHFGEMTSEAELAQSAIGQQSVSATPLQMNLVAAAIGNGGTMMHPQLVEVIRGSDLQILDQPGPEVLHDVTDEDVAEQITEMMVETVNSGTAQSAQSDRFQIAAKTGTAETGEEGVYNTWITGFAPADDPQYAVTIVYERIDYQTGTSLVGPQLRTMLEAVITE